MFLSPCLACSRYDAPDDSSNLSILHLHLLERSGIVQISGISSILKCIPGSTSINLQLAGVHCRL